MNYYELRIVIDGQFSILALLRALWTYDLGRLAMTIGHLGALLLFCRSGWLPWLQRSLAAVGQMALSNYASHSLICAFVFYGFGLGWYGYLERHQLYYVVFSIWIVQLIISPLLAIATTIRPARTGKRRAGVHRRRLAGGSRLAARANRAGEPSPAVYLGTATVGAVYILTSLVSLNVLAPEVLAASSSPLTAVGRQLLGDAGGILISLGALVSTAGCLNVNMLGTGQIAMAAARDGLFPGVFARLSARHTPAVSYSLAGILASVLLIFSFTESLVGAWTFVSLLATLTGVPAFAMAALASIAYQRRENAVTAGESIPAVATLVTCVWIVASSGIAVALWGLVLLVAGLPVYRLMKIRTETVNRAGGPIPPTALG